MMYTEVDLITQDEENMLLRVQYIKHIYGFIYLPVLFFCPSYLLLHAFNIPTVSY